LDKTLPPTNQKRWHDCEKRGSYAGQYTRFRIYRVSEVDSSQRVVEFRARADATVQILNAKTNAIETKKVSELDKKEKQRMEETLKGISSISVSATKP
jgi:hypothetical protein